MTAIAERNATATSNPPKLLDRMRASLRVKHYALSTERNYCHWVARFIRYHRMRHPQDMGAAEVEAFLSHLATAEDVAAGTQKGLRERKPLFFLVLLRGVEPPTY